LARNRIFGVAHQQDLTSCFGGGLRGNWGNQRQKEGK
jgi:hypothetical protein